jgi:hypothetical protein
MTTIREAEREVERKVKTQRQKRVEQSIPHSSVNLGLNGSISAAEVGFCLTSLDVGKPKAIIAAISIHLEGLRRIFKLFNEN